jgi:hypothetical protein
LHPTKNCCKFAAVKLHPIRQSLHQMLRGNTNRITVD